MCCCFLYWSWVFTHSWKAFLCMLLTEGFTCVCFWYLYIEASYFRSSDLVSLFFCLVWEMDLILSFSKQWSTRLASCYLTDHDCRGELRCIVHHTLDSAAAVWLRGSAAPQLSRVISPLSPGEVCAGCRNVRPEPLLLSALSYSRLFIFPYEC